MSVELRCSSCTRMIKAPPDWREGQLTCPVCGQAARSAQPVAEPEPTTEPVSLERQQVFCCLWFFPMAVCMLAIGVALVVLVIALVAKSPAQARMLGNLSAYALFPACCILALLLARRGAKKGWLPGTKKRVRIDDF